MIGAELYTKGECVLRSEAIVHNTEALHCGLTYHHRPAEVAREGSQLSFSRSQNHRLAISAGLLYTIG